MRILFLAGLLMACDDHKFSGGHGNSEPVTGSGYEAVQDIFANSCTGCHAANSTPPALDGDLCNDIVGVASSIGMSQVEAGDADNSYLLHKINDTHLDVGGNGGSMPIGGSLSADEIAILTDWIDEGAECESPEE